MKGSKNSIGSKLEGLADQYIKDVRSVLTGGGPMAHGKPERMKDTRLVKGRKTAKPVSKAGGQTALYEFIKANPGVRSEQMPPFDGKAITLKVLLASGHLRSMGRARGTSYTATKKAYK